MFWVILSNNSTSGLVISQPKYSYTKKVVHAVIRSVGMCVRVRALVKNIMGITTPIVKNTLPHYIIHKHLIEFISLKSCINSLQFCR